MWHSVSDVPLEIIHFRLKCGITHHSLSVNHLIGLSADWLNPLSIFDLRQTFVMLLPWRRRPVVFYTTTTVCPFHYGPKADLSTACEITSGTSHNGPDSFQLCVLRNTISSILYYFIRISRPFSNVASRILLWRRRSERNGHTERLTPTEMTLILAFGTTLPHQML